MHAMFILFGEFWRMCDFRIFVVIEFVIEWMGGFTALGLLDAEVCPPSGIEKNTVVMV